MQIAESLKAWTVSQLSPTDRITQNSFGKCFAKANEKTANQIGKFTIEIHGTAAEAVTDIDETADNAYDEIWAALTQRFGDISGAS